MLLSQRKPRWKRLSPLALLLLPALFATRGGAQDAAPPQVRYPDPDAGVDALRRASRRSSRALAEFKVFHQFQFSDRLKESGITFVHQAVDDVTQALPAGPLRPRQRPRGGRRGRRRARRPLLRQPGRRQRALEEPRRTAGSENITAQAGVGAGRADRRHRVVRRHRQRRRPGPLRDHRARRQRPVRERRPRPLPATSRKEAGRRPRRALLRGRLLRLRQRRPARPLRRATSAVHRATRRGPDGDYVGLADAFCGPPAPERTEYPRPLPEPGRQPLRGRDARRLGCVAGRLERRRQLRRPERRRLAGPLRAQHAGRQPLLRERGGQAASSRRPPSIFPKTPWGAMGIKFFDYDNDGAPGPAHHRHALGHERGDRPRAREAEVAHRSGRTASCRAAPTTSSATPSTTTWAAAASRRSRTRMGVENYWPWGLSVGDLNADGWEDVFITSGMGFPFRYGINSLLLNDRGEKFLDAEFLLGRRAAARTAARHTPWFDLDCADRGPRRARRARARHGRDHASWTPLSSRSSVIFDLDERRRPRHRDQRVRRRADGARERPRRSAKPIRWLEVVLVGTRLEPQRARRDRARPRRRASVLARCNDGKSGYLSQSVLPLYFGLGDAAKIDTRRGRLALGPQAGRDEGAQAERHDQDQRAALAPLTRATGGAPA